MKLVQSQALGCTLVTRLDRPLSKTRTINACRSGWPAKTVPWFLLCSASDGAKKEHCQGSIVCVEASEKKWDVAPSGLAFGLYRKIASSAH